MDHRRLLAIALVVPFVLAGLTIVTITPRWQGFFGQATTTLGTFLTLWPAAVIAARMLRALPENEGGPPSALRAFAQSIAQKPQR